MSDIDETMFKVLERHGNRGLKRHAQWVWDKIKEAIR